MADHAGMTIEQALGDYLRGVWPPLNAHDVAAEVAVYAVAWLRALPVPQRMEAMGITPVQAWDAFGAALVDANFVKLPTPEEDA